MKKSRAPYDETADITFTYEDIQLLFEATASYIATEKNCAGAVDPQYVTLHNKLGEYLHG